VITTGRMSLAYWQETGVNEATNVDIWRLGCKTEFSNSRLNPSIRTCSFRI
jgi:hypothetical protein